MTFLIVPPPELTSSDPWWIYTTCNLFWVIKSEYGFGIIELVRESPRFGIMLLSMCLSIVFLVVDTLSVLHVFNAALPTGINPFWKVRELPLFTVAIDRTLIFGIAVICFQMSL